MDRTRAARGVLAAGAVAFVAAIAIMSQTPGPRAWSLHLPGFLAGPERTVVMALLVSGAALLLIDFFQRGGASSAEPHQTGPQHGKGASPARGSKRRAARERGSSRSASDSGMPGWVGWLLLLPWAWLLMAFATRTLFLGDGEIWLENVRSGHPNPYSEPLATATWWLYWKILSGMHVPFVQATAAVLPVLCGVVAGALLWGIAGEITPRTGARVTAFAVLATMGMVQLYFGYIESYPMVSVGILTYLWLGLRRARGLDHLAWSGAALAVAIAFHLSCAYLVPSFFVLALREKRPLAARAGLALAPLAVAAALLLVLGYSPSRWVSAFAIAAGTVDPEHAAGMLAKPYGFVSLDHAVDVLNAILLALPVPLILLLAGVTGGAREPKESREGLLRDPATLFVLSAALPGLLLATALVLPVAPAQDWDLSSILLLPLAVLGVKAAFSVLPMRGRRALGVTLLGAGSLLSFVLVNAGEESGLHRYEALVGPGAKITAYARGYGNDLLATHDLAKQNLTRALAHAQRAIDAEPATSRYWVKKGAALFQMGRYDEAIPILEESIRRGPRDDGYYDLGNCLSKLKRYPEAVASYREAIRITQQPRPEFFNNLGVALFNSGKKDSARVVWIDVVRRWPWYTLARRSLIENYRDDAEGVTPGATPG